MSVAENYDANDIARLHGLEKVREAFAMRRAPWPEVPPAEAYADEFGGSEAAPEPGIIASPFVWRPTAQIPAREWLYGKHYIRKFVSLDIAAGGVGKSSVIIAEALAMVTGRALLGKEVIDGPHRVWLYNLEDPDEETERRIHAAMIRHQVKPDELGGRLFVNSGRAQPVVLAEETPSGARILRPVAEAIIAQIKQHSIDVLAIDPFVSSHRVSENDNRAIDMVAKEWARIADVCHCSVNLVHHVRKSNGHEVNAESARGAGSLLGAVRAARVYNRMTREEGERAGVEPDKRGFYFRVQNDKPNLAPPEAAEWYRMDSVDLDNGDQVGVACRWQWPDAFDGVSTWHLKQVQARIAGGEWRADARASNWAGQVVAEVVGLDPAKDRGRIRDILKQWIATDMLREVERPDEARRPRVYLEVGQWFET